MKKLLGYLDKFGSKKHLHSEFNTKEKMLDLSPHVQHNIADRKKRLAMAADE
jgi:hypothetical protein